MPPQHALKGSLRLGMPIGKLSFFLRKGKTMERIHLELLTIQMAPYIPETEHTLILNMHSPQNHCLAHHTQQRQKRTPAELRLAALAAGWSRTHTDMKPLRRLNRQPHKNTRLCLVPVCQISPPLTLRCPPGEPGRVGLSLALMVELSVQHLKENCGILGGAREAPTDSPLNRPLPSPVTL